MNAEAESSDKYFNDFLPIHLIMYCYHYSIQYLNYLGFNTLKSECHYVKEIGLDLNKLPELPELL